MRILYSIIFILTLPILLLRLCWRGLKAPAYFKRWDERFGLSQYQTTDKPIIWVHAVSVGEVEASRPLIAGLKEQYPQHQILVTSMTPTGSARVKALFTDAVLHYYLPYDLPFSLARFLNKLHPVMLIIMETELWPNLIYQCKQHNIPMILANARLSEKSAQGYQKIAKTMREMLHSFTLIAAQSQGDKQRLIQLGAKATNTHSTGNLKFEINMKSTLIEEAEAIRSMWGNRHVFIAASTHEGEDEIILNACRRIRSHIPDLLLIVVPRHPERFNKVTALCQKNGHKTLRRSEKALVRSDVEVLVIDTMGELPLFYAVADVAFVGGSLVPTGGHNILEPASLGRAIISGPHYFNFKEITQYFLDDSAIKLVHNSEELSDTVIELLTNPQLRAEMGERGMKLIQRHQGASQRLLNLIKRHIHV